MMVSSLIEANPTDDVQNTTLNKVEKNSAVFDTTNHIPGCSHKDLSFPTLSYFRNKSTRKNVSIEIMCHHIK